MLIYGLIAWAAYLGHAKLAVTPWHFKSNDSSSLRGNVEGHCDGLCLHPDCFLSALGCFSWAMDLAMHTLGCFVKGLVVFGAAECIKLL